MREEVKEVMETEKEEERSNRGKKKKKKIRLKKWYPSRDPAERQERSKDG